MQEALADLKWERIVTALTGSAETSYTIAAIHPTKWQEGEVSRHAEPRLLRISMREKGDYLLGAVLEHAVERSFCGAGDFFNYELRYISVAMRDAFSKILLGRVEGGLPHLRILVKKSATGVFGTGVQRNPFLPVKLSGYMSGFHIAPQG